MSRGPLSDPTSLLGVWRLSRVVEDRLTGERSRVEGTLTLSEVSPGRIRWDEQGRWHRVGGDMTVTRTLWVVRDEETAGWWVRFEDEREFHPWRPEERVVHPCAPDSYSGLVGGTPSGWTVEWDATGPAKDYSMRTALSPS